MAVQFDPNSVSISVEDGGAKPRVFVRQGVDGSQVAFNLSKGFNMDPSAKGFAFTFEGTVNATQGTDEELGEFTFGFIQLIRMPTLTIVYQGKRADEGHVVINAGAAVGSDFMFDLNRNVTPVQLPFYMRASATRDASGFHTTMGDHPDLKLPQIQHNFTTDYDNHLFQAIETLQAVSIFSARRLDGTFQHFAHLEWSVTFSAKFRWRGGQIEVAEEPMSFQTGVTLARPPTNPFGGDVTGLLKRLGPSVSPIFNDRLQSGMRAAFSQNNANRKDNTGAFPGAPANFFQ